METVHTFDPVAVGIRIDGQVVGDVDAAENEGLALELDLAGDICAETTASGGDVPRF